MLPGLLRRVVIYSLLLTLFAPSLSAHPHVWADVKAEVAVAGGYVDGVWSVWTFDEVFSQLILADHDDGDGRLSIRESASVKKGYFDNLKVYDYFTHLGLGAKKLPVPSPERFEATVSTDGRVSYRFFLPLGLRLDAKTALAVSFYDETFFTDLVFVKTNPLNLKVSDGGKATVAWKKDGSKTYYGGQVTPLFAYVQWSPP